MLLWWGVKTWLDYTIDVYTIRTFSIYRPQVTRASFCALVTFSIVGTCGWSLSRWVVLLDIGIEKIIFLERRWWLKLTFVTVLQNKVLRMEGKGPALRIVLGSWCLCRFNHQLQSKQPVSYLSRIELISYADECIILVTGKDMPRQTSQQLLQLVSNWLQDQPLDLSPG